VTHVLYFTAEWCNPCQKTKPVAEKLRRDGIIDFLFIDVDTEIQLVNKFSIKSVPTFILLKDGLEVKRTTGAQTRQEFLDFINE
jgi:thiol-disulfide isomerase/thioredoxin